MTSIYVEIEERLAQMWSISSHPYLKTILGEPPVPQHFVEKITKLLGDTDLPHDRREVFCIAISLLYMGLYIHTKVKMEEIDHEQVKERQLLVLAGDYYSSLFYRTLVQAGEITGIHYFANITAKINEQLMNLHQELSFNYLLKSEQMISESLLAAVADFFHTRR